MWWVVKGISQTSLAEFHEHLIHLWHENWLQPQNWFFWRCPSLISQWDEDLYREAFCWKPAPTVHAGSDWQGESVASYYSPGKWLALKIFTLYILFLTIFTAKWATQLWPLQRTTRHHLPVRADQVRCIQKARHWSDLEQADKGRHRRSQARSR